MSFYSKDVMKLLSAVCLLSMISCGEEKMKSNRFSGQDGSSYNAELSENENSNDISNYDGVWKQQCQAAGTSTFIRNTISIIGGSATILIEISLNPNCSQPIVITELKHTFLETGESETVAGAINITQTMVSVTNTNLVESMVDYSNQNSLFGYQDWQKGVAKDVAGKSSDGQSEAMPAINEKAYTIIKLQNNKLYIGKSESGGELDGSSEQNREKALDLENPFTKQ